ncbi:MAG: CvpA family protein [Clostridia bacterium]|nr:CvpA family protein [Clostridia bacterium]
MNIILDVVVVAIVLICAFLSAKRGFVRALLETVGFVLAIMIAINISSPVADFVYDKVVSPTIEKKVVTTIDEATSGTSAAITDTIWEKLPKFVSNAAEKSGVTKDTVSNKLVSGTDSAAIAQNISQEILAPIVTTVIKYIATAVLFLILLFVVKLLARIINKLFKKSLFGGANAALGGVLGAAKGAIYAILFCIIVSLLTNVSKDNFFITNEIIENTTVFKFILNLIPFKF